MPIPTTSLLRPARIDRHHHAAARVVAAMRRDGLALHLSYGPSGASWRLSNGKSVSPETASLVIVNANVVSDGDALFQDMPAQKFRFAE